jgi:DNA-binding protein H-NS
MALDIASLSFEELRTLSREVAALIAKRRHETLERLREEASILGFTADELIPSKRKPESTVKYSDGNGNTWSGKGKRPGWLIKAIAEGANIEEFAV